MLLPRRVPTTSSCGSQESLVSRYKVLLGTNGVFSRAAFLRDIKVRSESLRSGKANTLREYRRCLCSPQMNQERLTSKSSSVDRETMVVGGREIC